MIDKLHHGIDFEDSGSGPCLLFIPGSFSNAAAWRPIRARLDDRYRVVATSLLGYGGTTERRREGDPSLEPHVAQVEALVDRAGEPVHLITFSFGAVAALAACLSGRVRPASLTLIDAIPIDLLRQTGHVRELEMVMTVTLDYERAARAGEADSARHIIDMWGGEGTYDSFGEGALRFIREATPAMLRDCVNSHHFRVPRDDYRRLSMPTHIVCGAAGHPAMLRMAGILAEAIPGARLSPVPGATHQLIFTHADEVARLIDLFVGEVAD